MKHIRESNMNEVKTVKKIKKVVSEPNFIGVNLGKGNDVGTFQNCISPIGINTEPRKDLPQFPKTIKKVKKMKSILKLPKTE